MPVSNVIDEFPFVNVRYTYARINKTMAVCQTLNNRLGVVDERQQTVIGQTVHERCRACRAFVRHVPRCDAINSNGPSPFLFPRERLHRFQVYNINLITERLGQTSLARTWFEVALPSSPTFSKLPEFKNIKVLQEDRVLPDTNVPAYLA